MIESAKLILLCSPAHALVFYVICENLLTALHYVKTAVFQSVNNHYGIPGCGVFKGGIQN